MEMEKAVFQVMVSLLVSYI